MGEVPTKAALDSTTEEVHALPFYRSMIERFGSAGAAKHATRGELWQMIAQLTDAIGKLRAEIAELKSSAQEFPYKGVWREGGVYAKGDFCTHQGGLWFANEANSARPGGGSGAWTLAVKRGHGG